MHSFPMFHVAYGTEPYVGRALRDCGLSRSEFFITTKWSGLSPMEEAIRSSLDNVSVLLSMRLTEFPRERILS